MTFVKKQLKLLMTNMVLLKYFVPIILIKAYHFDRFFYAQFLAR
jgi:hypothetical protein